MNTPTTDAIQYATRPYVRAGYQIESIERGRVTLTRRVHERGSILVLVVVLLVLLALMGTAYITTTRTDRYSAEQNKANTQIDLLMDGVKQMAVSRVTNLAADYQTGLYLSPRHPDALGTTSTDPVAWPSIGISLTATAFPGSQFVDPTTGTIIGPFTAPNKDSYYFQPDSVVGGDSKTHPAFVLRNRSGGAIDYTFMGTTFTRFLAADTDGDGIADAGFFPIPGAAIDGLTYYAAVRIIDNNSALNVNTAWSQTDFDGNGNPVTNPNQGLFLTSTGLAEILGTYTSSATMNQGTEAKSLDAYRWGTGAFSASQQNGVLGETGTLACVYDDAGNKRETPSGSNTPDFQFSSQGAALNSQLSLRVDNPGKNGSASTYRSFPLSDSFLLSYPFAIRPPTSSVSMNSLETTLSTTLNSAHTAYAPNAAGTWFQDNFAWGDRTTAPADATTPSLGRRSYFVTRNPVLNTVTPPGTPPLPNSPPLPLDMPPGDTDPIKRVKADANTSDFPTLWRAYWGVMGDSTGATPTGSMFLNPVRPCASLTTILKADQTRALRAALAAANTIALREGTNADPDTDVVPAFTVALDSSATMYAVVYGLKRQPFISECLIQRDDTSSTDFTAIEIFNPTPVAVNLTNYRIAVLDRTGTAPVISTSYAMPAAVTNLPANSHIVLYDGTAPGTAPANGSIALPGSGEAPRAGLNTALAKGELVLIRPRDPAGATSGTMTPATTHNAYDETTFAGDPTKVAAWIPVDQVDLRQAAKVTGDIVRYKYTRPSDATGANNRWSVAYGGSYGVSGSGHDLDKVSGALAVNALASDSSLGSAETAPLPLITTAAPLFPNGIPIEVNAFGHVGPNPWQGSATPKQFPFGGFARNGDLLQVPFIGSYKIIDATTGNLVELNSVSIDAVSAADRTIGQTMPVDAANPAYVQAVGRFWPYTYPVITAPASYNWARNLFDYVTVQSPQNDFLPNVQATPVTGSDYATVTGAAAPQKVPNGPILSPAQANGTNEWSVGVNGLININTASWKVLSMLPLVVNASGQVDTAKSESMAKAIVAYRESNGPYKTVFDLVSIPADFASCSNPAFAHLATSAAPNTPVVTDTAGYGELMGTGGDAEFRRNVLQLSRISNLVTTRSDTFTVYLLVQGWRNGALEVERRSAFYVDRTNLSTTNPNPIVVPIPTK